jgi:hypothetical protein
VVRVVGVGVPGVARGARRGGAARRAAEWQGWACRLVLRAGAAARPHLQRIVAGVPLYAVDSPTSMQQPNGKMTRCTERDAHLHLSKKHAGALVVRHVRRPRVRPLVRAAAIPDSGRRLHDVSSPVETPWNSVMPLGPHAHSALDPSKHPLVAPATLVAITAAAALKPRAQPAKLKSAESPRPASSANRSHSAHTQLPHPARLQPAQKSLPISIFLRMSLSPWYTKESTRPDTVNTPPRRTHCSGSAGRSSAARRS